MRPFRSGLESRVTSRGSPPTRLGTRDPGAGTARRGAGGILDMLFREDAAELAVPAAELDQGLVERLLVEVGPQGGRGVVFGVGRLPDEEIAQAHLACRAHDQVGIGQARGEQVLGDGLLGYLLRLETRSYDLAHR